MSSGDEFVARIGIREETEKLLKAARLKARAEEESGAPREKFRAGNGAFSNDKLIRKALSIWAAHHKDEVDGLDS